METVADLKISSQKWPFPPLLGEMMNLKLCPCGKTPNTLYITGASQGGKWAHVSGDCCGEWELEFRTGYNALDSDECMRLAIEWWNDATRGQ